MWCDVMWWDVMSATGTLRSSWRLRSSPPRHSIDSNLADGAGTSPFGDSAAWGLPECHRRFQQQKPKKVSRPFESVHLMAALWTGGLVPDTNRLLSWGCPWFSSVVLPMPVYVYAGHCRLPHCPPLTTSLSSIPRHCFSQSTNCIWKPPWYRVE